MKEIIKKVYRFVFPNLNVELQKAANDCKTILDVGCGSSSPIKSISKSFCVGIDAFQKSIDESKRQKIHDKYYRMDALDIEKKFRPDSFDCVLMLDLIEHFKKAHGLKLLRMAERIAKKRVIILTPNGFLVQKKYRGNPWQVHKSGWRTEEMRKLGYRVIGINGWKFLRGKRAHLRFNPISLWLIVSDMTQLFVRNHPEKAFHLLCVKEMK